MASSQSSSFARSSSNSATIIQTSSSASVPFEPVSVSARAPTLLATRSIPPAAIEAPAPPAERKLTDTRAPFSPGPVVESQPVSATATRAATTPCPTRVHVMSVNVLLFASHPPRNPVRIARGDGEDTRCPRLGSADPPGTGATGMPRLL